MFLEKYNPGQQIKHVPTLLMKKLSFIWRKPCSGGYNKEVGSSNPKASKELDESCLKLICCVDKFQMK